MFSSNSQDVRNTADVTLPLINTDRRTKEVNISIADSNEIYSSSIISNTLLKLDGIRLKQTNLEEKINDIQNDMNLIDKYDKQIEKFQPLLTYTENLEKLKEKFQFFRLFISRFCSDLYNWKSLANSIYHIQHLMNNLDNYQIKEFLQKQFKVLLNYFILFIKDLITIQINSQKEHQTNENIPQPNSPEIEQHIQNLKIHLANLKELILTAKERFNICQTDINAIQTLLHAVNSINFESKNFDKQDQEQLRLLKLKQDLSQKSNKTDLIQLKTYIDKQIKNLIELNKQNAKDLHRIKLLKTATCEARQVQTILSTNPSFDNKKSNRIYSHQSSRPYITFELDQIRKYQHQALLKSPYGTIPLYRRQAWAAANLFPNHSLHFLRYIQNSLRMQIHHLLGYDPSEIYNTNKKKQKPKNSNIGIFHTNRDISIVGNNNKLYRGRIDSCQIIPLKTSKAKRKFQTKTNIEDNNEIIKVHFDQLDQTNKTIADEHLFEYLDWQTQFHEQDLPDELCEELFQHWKSLICEEQTCICKSESKSIFREEDHLISTEISSTSSLSSVYDDRCMCSNCSCDCEKYQSICVCSQCSCECLKDSQSENIEEHLTNEINVIEEVDCIPDERMSVVEPVEEDEVIISDCFLNRTDRWTQQFDIFQENDRSAMEFNIISNPSELDDPTVYRQRILERNSA